MVDTYIDHIIMLLINAGPISKTKFKIQVKKDLTCE